MIGRHIFILFLLVTGSYCDPNTCKSADQCGKCISNPDCVWCKDEDPLITTRCQPKIIDGSFGQCKLLEDPKGKIEIIENVNIDPETRDNIVLIQPQKVKLSLRPGEKKPEVLTFKAGQSKQYPLDIYFLLDLSWSMKKSRNNFAQQGGNIISNIKKITEDLKIGFGSFIDKNLPPFTSTYSEFNCPPENPKCTPPYSFYHQTSLSSLSEEQFKKEVLSAPLAGNVDEPEGGLDALMQAMVCWDHIGWRKQSRKIILLATDRDFHYAMDGKLVGILEPNDGQCHLNGTTGQPGFYTHSTILDYPSISQINYEAQKESFVIIFAIIPRYKGIYSAMADLITGSFVEILETDSSNIVEIIRQRYEEITSSLQISLNNIPEGLRISLKSNCGKGGEANETNSCTDVELGTSVTFTAEIKINKCLPGPTSFSISPVGLNQSLVVQVETLCNCGCENPDGGQGYEADSGKCSSQGAYTCGICKCNPGFSGRSCECDSRSIPDAADPVELCKDPKQPDKVCNGVGHCQCSICICNPETKTYGRYCECDDVSCSRTNDEFCSGHGSCKCGICQCDEYWSGEDCSCFQDENQCISPYNGNKCSGFGDCVCSKCKCRADEKGGGVYAGGYCELESKEAHPCSILKDCVECQAFETGPLKDSCKESCLFTLEEVAVENATTLLGLEERCSFINSKGCTYFFSSYYEPEPGLRVYLHIIDDQKEECPQVDALGISLGIFGTLILIGLATMLFYIGFIRIQDKIQYAAFQREAQNVKWATNEAPLYKSPVTTYQNPMYNKAN